MMPDFARMDAETASKIRAAGTIEERERLVENLRRKEAIIFAELSGGSSNVVPIRRKKP